MMVRTLGSCETGEEVSCSLLEREGLAVGARGEEERGACVGVGV